MDKSKNRTRPFSSVLTLCVSDIQHKNVCACQVRFYRHISTKVNKIAPNEALPSSSFGAIEDLLLNQKK